MGESLAMSPSFLIVPGLNDSGSHHWQSLWQGLLKNARKAELGSWGNPDREDWVVRLDEAIKSLRPPVVICAHSLGCHAVAWWAATKAKNGGFPVAGAMLVAPPDCDRRERLPNVSGFSPMPFARLPFPSFLIASRDDTYASIDDARGMARTWGARFIDGGRLGHINAESELGLWPQGLSLLGRLLRVATPRVAH